MTAPSTIGALQTTTRFRCPGCNISTAISLFVSAPPRSTRTATPFGDQALLMASIIKDTLVPRPPSDCPRRKPPSPRCRPSGAPCRRCLWRCPEVRHDDDTDGVTHRRASRPSQTACNKRQLDRAPGSHARRCALRGTPPALSSPASAPFAPPSRLPWCEPAG